MGELSTCPQKTPIGRGYRGVNWRHCTKEGTHRVVWVDGTGAEHDRSPHGPMCERHAREWAARYDRPVEIRALPRHGEGRDE